MTSSTSAGKRNAILIGCIICAVVVLIGTIATTHLASPASGEPLDIYKVGGAWLIVGAIIGRIAYNFRTDRAKGPAARS